VLDFTLRAPLGMTLPWDASIEVNRGFEKRFEFSTPTSKLVGAPDFARMSHLNRFSTPASKARRGPGCAAKMGHRFLAGSTVWGEKQVRFDFAQGRLLHYALRASVEMTRFGSRFDAVSVVRV
jgi:hypothetical protein